MYGQDSHEYLRCSKELKDFLLNGTPVSEFHWPKAFSFSGALLSFTGLSVEFSMRLIALFALLGTLVYTRKTVRVIYGGDATLLLILGAVTQVYFVRGGILVMSDMLCCFFITLLIYHYFQLVLQEKSRSIIWLLAFAILAFFTRYASIPVIMVPVLHAIWVFLSKQKKMVLVTFIIGIIACAVALVMVNSNLVKTALGIEWRVGNIFSRTFTANEGQIHAYTVPNMLYVFGNFFHIGFLSMGIFLVPFFKQLKSTHWLLFAIFGVYLLFLSGLITQNYRFFIVTHPLTLILLFPSFQGLLSWLKTKRLSVIFIAGTIAFNIAFFMYSFPKTYRVHAVEKEVALSLKALNDDAVIYAFYVDQSFPTYDIKNEVHNLYQNKYEEFEKGALVVFNEQKFSDDWKDNNVMINWNYLNQTCELEVIKTLRDNWKIYRIK